MKPHPYLTRLENATVGELTGRVTKISSNYVEADGPLCTVGDICEIAHQPRNFQDNITPQWLAEVAAVGTQSVTLIPLSQTAGILPGAKVIALPFGRNMPVGEEFSGRLVNALAEPIDGGGAIDAPQTLPSAGHILTPMERAEPDRVLQTGIRAIDGLLTVGRGQRLGVFAASGVGKTSLLKQLADQVDCDRCVLCLVGERGREVEMMWRELGGLENAPHLSCVAATSDMSAVLRVRAVYQAVCLAEHWRAQGEHVLLLVDSVTRFAMALREIGLAAGAPPTLRAYTPNVFNALPRLVERCGGAKSGGSITAIMTVLSETDDVDDPIVEVMKSLLDGHIILSRQLAEFGHFPAIDVPRSVSRQSQNLMDTGHAKNARQAISLLSTYEEAKVIIDSGIYKGGSNALVDTAISSRDALSRFLQQASHENTPLAKTLEDLKTLTSGGSINA